MGLFDLLFIVLFLAAASALLSAAWFAARGDSARARRIFLRLLAAAAAYMALVITASVVLPKRSVSLAEPQCFDDWCVAFAGIERSPKPDGVAYGVNLRLFSRARRISQREKHLVVYLRDDRGRRYNPLGDPSSIPFDVLLRPEESVTVSRSFQLPADAAGVGLVITHEGGFPIGWFIVGYDTWFRKPAMAPLQ